LSSSPARPAFDPRKLLIKSPAFAPGYALIASPQTAPLRWITFARLVLNSAARRYEASTGNEELVLDVYSGLVTVLVDHGGRQARIEVGGRASAFENAGMLFIPPGCHYSIECAAGEAVMALFSAPASVKPGGRPLHVPAEQAEVKTVGRDNWTRKVVTPVGDNVPAEKLIVGETTNPPGNWSSAPPHKHDRKRPNPALAPDPAQAPGLGVPPGEAVMEEVYYFQLQPPQGFGFMRVYTAPDDPAPFDEAFVVEHGDTVLIPRGYHPVVAGPGYQLHYTWALAGEERRYGAWADDPAHAWIR